MTMNKKQIAKLTTITVRVEALANELHAGNDTDLRRAANDLRRVLTAANTAPIAKAA